MSDWVLVPCLVTLRAEFNTVAPKRDRGSDGSIGDSNHKSNSDHTPDEDSDPLRDHDADSKNEVHALDIDSSGPWPGGPAWFDAAVKRIVDRHRRGVDDRLHYVIWNRQIASRDIQNWTWRAYKSTTDPHTGHAHFSARYTTAQEQDTGPWGLEGDDMPLNSDDKSFISDEVRDASVAALTLVLSEAYRAASGKAGGTTPEDRRARNWRDYLRGVVGGPVDVSGVPAATAAEVLRVLGSAASPETVAALSLIHKETACGRCSAPTPRRSAGSSPDRPDRRPHGADQRGNGRGLPE